ncbi:MAG: hypothetical protein HQL71_04440 [Magnetococcales bacterium]|nr:hypothetical protein [Magnetococcales bacterium]
MISANVVTQILSVSQTTSITNNPLREGGGKCGCGKHDDFMAILDSIAAKQPDGIAANSPFFPGLQNFSSLQSSTSDMAGLLAGILNGAGGDEQEQSPFDLIQSLTTSQMATFQAAQYSTQSYSDDNKTVKSFQVIMQHINDVDDNSTLFPPANAPQGVKDAWDNATKEASQRDIMLVTGMMFSMALSQSTFDTENIEQVELIDGSGTNQDIFSWEQDQYWEQVEALLALIDKSLMKNPDKSEDIEGAKGLLANFLDELENNEKSATVI